MKTERMNERTKKKTHLTSIHFCQFEQKLNPNYSMSWRVIFLEKFEDFLFIYLYIIFLFTVLGDVEAFTNSISFLLRTSYS